MIKNGVFIFFCIMLFACSKLEKDKPESVPTNSIWIGGEDGGCWMLFRSVKENSVDVIIFYEDGTIWDSGIFFVNGNCKINPKMIKEEISGFDGQRILTNIDCSFTK